MVYPRVELSKLAEYVYLLEIPSTSEAHFESAFKFYGKKCSFVD